MTDKKTQLVETGSHQPGLQNSPKRDHTLRIQVAALNTLRVQFGGKKCIFLGGTDGSIGILQKVFGEIFKKSDP